ncbi:sigma-70 family RNA polymerase sigma factor [Streptomyces sp. NPDC001380]|uniref:sigma-70 family RNA polymerase sigma factor n=1 Tax=Streptomyces sp. NPDC001380 TaxID=3364566 RepID=UPI0036B3F5B3
MGAEGRDGPGRGGDGSGPPHGGGPDGPQEPPPGGHVPVQGRPPDEEALTGPGAAGTPRVPGQAPAGFGGVTPAAAAPAGGAPGRVPAVPAPADPVDGDLPPSDAELAARVRGGDDGAYEELYRRHADAVRRYARTCCRDSFTAEDLAGEVFARTLQALRAGRGPDLAVRAYLLTAVRNVAAAWSRGERREHLVADFAALADSSAAQGRPDGADPGADAWALARADRRMVIRAFTALPEEDRVVLWHTEVEREPPRQVAVLLGKTANATAVQAHRARDRLAAAFLQAHVSAVQDDACRRHAERLGAHARGALRKRASAETEAHLAGCDRCSAAYLELLDLNAGLRAVLPGGVLVWVGAGYFTAAAVATGAAFGGAAAGTAGGGAGSTAAEGMGAAAKAAVGAVAAAAVAGVVLAYALSGGTARPPARAVPPAAPSQVVPPSVPPGRGTPPPRTPAPHRTGDAPVPGPRPVPAPVPPRAAPAPDRHPVLRPVRRPTAAPPPPARPRTPLPPAPRPAPAPPPLQAPPAVDRHWLDELPFAVVGPARSQGVHGPGTGWSWNRHGLGTGGVRSWHGVTVGAPSEVSVDLGRRCATFDALAGIDDMAQGLGRVVFSVVGGDGRTLWRSSPVAGGGTVGVHVPLAGQRSVRLVVEPAGGGWSLLDVADWADARLGCRG